MSSVLNTQLNMPSGFIGVGQRQTQSPVPSQQPSGNAYNQPNIGGASGMTSAPGAAISQKDRRLIWQGLLEWQEKPKAPNTDLAAKFSNNIHTSVFSSLTPTGELEVTADKWPKKLMLQFFPRQLINVCGQYFKNARSVQFQFTGSNVIIDMLSKMMANQGPQVGCINLNPQLTQNSEVRMLMLLYNSDKRTFIGIIPIDQPAFLNAIRSAIKAHAARKQQNPDIMGPGMGNNPSPICPQPNLSGPMPMQTSDLLRQNYSNIRQPQHAGLFNQQGSNSQPTSLSMILNRPNMAGQGMGQPQQQQQQNPNDQRSMFHDDNSIDLV